MKKISYLLVITIIIVVLFVFVSNRTKDHCLTGAFIADQPAKKVIRQFQSDFGKKPYLVMVFVDWGNFVNDEIVTDIYSMGCILLVTWEPWHAISKEGVDYDAILSGGMDPYIRNFAGELKRINKPVFLRFAHEMNGDWYPWSALRMGAEKYIAVYRYIRDIFDDIHADNVRWVFSINSEDVPKENNYMDCYPGDKYVDFIGLDGYNWGNTKPWSKWMSFKEIFKKSYDEIMVRFKKPIIISEFSSTSGGGNKSIWIRKAMSDIKTMRNIKAFILFNVDKETDWSFPVDRDFGKELKLQLKNSYFKDKDGLYDQ